MRIAFFGRFFCASGPTAEKQRPKSHRAGNNQQPKSPRAVRGVRINSPDPEDREWQGKQQPAGQICPSKIRHVAVIMVLGFLADAPLWLSVERVADDGPDEHDRAENNHILDTWFHQRINDVGSDQNSNPSSR